MTAVNVLGQDDPPITPGEVAPFLPESVALDLSEIPEHVFAEGNPNNPSTAASYDSMARELQNSLILARAADPYITRALTMASSIRSVMIGPDQTHVSGVFDINGVNVPYRADFSAFDIDGDEVADGSGSPAVEPVALRIWVDHGEGYKRFVCALVGARPSEENGGFGRIIIRPNAADPSVASNMRMDARWSRIDPGHVWNQIHLTGQVDQVGFVSLSHQRLDIRARGNDPVEKHLQVWANFDNRPIIGWPMLTQVHLRSGQPWAKISVTGGSGCFELPTISYYGNDRPAQCDGFDLQDQYSLSGVSDASFPMDFPLKPTF